MFLKRLVFCPALRIFLATRANQDAMPENKTLTCNKLFLILAFAAGENSKLLIYPLTGLFSCKRQQKKGIYCNYNKYYVYGN